MKKITELNDTTIVLSYNKINPTKYVVNVNSSAPFFLVLSETYHKDWVIYVNGSIIEEKYHFTANGYANAWYINKTGYLRITIEFHPQVLVYYGFAISGITLMLSFYFLLIKDTILIYYKQ